MIACRMNIKEVQDKLFYISWSIYLFVTLWNQSFFPLIFTGKNYVLLLVFCLLLLFIKELINIDFNYKSVVMALGMSIIGIFVLIFSMHQMLLVVMFFIFSARNIDINKVINISLFISVSVLCIVSVSALSGVIYNQTSIDLVRDRERQYLGFAYVLFPVAIWSNITCLWMVKRKDVFTWLEIVILFVVNQILYEYTSSRLVYLIVMIRILSIIIITKVNVVRILRSAMIKKTLIYSTVIACSFAFYVTINYNSSDLYQYLINMLLENRLELGQNAIQTYGWPMFGEKIQWVGNGLDENGLKVEGIYNYVDCAYIHFMLEYGVIALALYMWVIIKYMQNLANKNEIVIMIVFFTLAIHSIIDDATITLHYNTCLFLLSTLIPSRKTIR